MRLGEACGIHSGQTPRGGLVQSGPLGVLAVQQGDLSPTGDFDPSSALRISAPTYSPRHVAAIGDVLFRSRGPFWSAWKVDDIGEPLLAIAPLFILRPTSDILDAGYLAWQLMQPAAQRYFATESMGSGVKMITKPLLESLDVPLPPLDVQRAIAEAARLSAQERRLTRHAADLRQRLQAVRLHSLTTETSGPVTTTSIRKSV